MATTWLSCLAAAIRTYGTKDLVDRTCALRDCRIGGGNVPVRLARDCLKSIKSSLIEVRLSTVYTVPEH